MLKYLSTAVLAVSLYVPPALFAADKTTVTV